jgi:hypothetical protein
MMKWNFLFCNLSNQQGPSWLLAKSPKNSQCIFYHMPYLTFSSHMHTYSSACTVHSKHGQLLLGILYSVAYFKTGPPWLRIPSVLVLWVFKSSLPVTHTICFGAPNCPRFFSSQSSKTSVERHMQVLTFWQWEKTSKGARQQSTNH